ncbi:protein Wnt-4-like [Uloborus diversus]|uniref:protein Wnt-4-like n=1 Tax=Uloborus diversus TaxID=327109 RepID=UPI00240A55D1|nr:protein Wnt-4-like [Uloborus diversus]
MCGVQRSRKSLSWESPSDCVRAARTGVLAPVQKAACKANLALMPVLSSASRRVAEACQQVFRTHRWNCSSVEKAPNFGQDLLRGTREQAYVSALSSAGLAVGVARACAEGRIRVCGCGRPSPREPPPADFSWGGCADDVGFGVRAAKAFSSEPFDRKKFAGDVAIRMHRHNSRAGWRAVRDSQRVQCKCHGVSGSCEVKTCWHALPPLLEVAQKLKLRHRNAEEVRPVMVGRGTKLLPATNARFNKDDLVYREQSPDYCVYDPKTGSEGTKGRQCNSTATDSFGCEAMCCSRGFLTTWVETEERCNCKFQRCCYVTCDVCKWRTNLNLCL